MSLARKMREYKRKTEKLYQMPESVQDLIPVFRIAEDGIFQLENKEEDEEKQFDKAYLFLDTNFATMEDVEKEDFLKSYCAVLNSLNVSFKISILNYNRNMDKVRKEIFIRNEEGRYKELVESFNKHMEDSISRGQQGIEQVRIFAITCRRKNVARAREFFRSVEANLMVRFNAMQSGLIPLNAAERLRYLYGFYRMGKEKEFDFDFQTAIKRGIDWKDMISPSVVRHYRNEDGTLDGMTLQMDNRYARVLYVPRLPNSINPDFVKKLTDNSSRMILTWDVEPIPQESTRKRLMYLYMQNGRAIEKQQKLRNKEMAWSSDITYERRREREELESYLDIMNDNDEKMFYVALYAVIIANSKTGLENAVTSFLSTAEGEGFNFEPAMWQQLDALNTALPTGGRFCNTMYPVFTQPLCGFTPFTVHELYHEGGIFYGINQVSKNILIGDRKRLKNGNGFTLGVTGGGKGMDTKQEMTQVFLNTKDDIIIIDPQNEYRDIIAYLGGEFVDFSPESQHYINPLDTGSIGYMRSRQAFLRDKTELMLSIFSVIKEDELSAQDKSIIGRCVLEVYKDEKAFKKAEDAPTLVDFSEVLSRQREPQARELKLALELFVTGALDMFAKPSNVNVKNRLTAYGLSDLGEEQAGISMIIMLEGIRTRIAENARKGTATWLYVEEFHNLAENELSARRLEKTWKEVRKLGGLCTGITQNIADALASKTVETMLCNSEYLSLLNQSEIEIDLFSKIFGISDNLLKYVHNSEPGCGLLKFGDKYIPKDSRLPGDSRMYQMFSTNFHEKVKQQRKKELQKQVSKIPQEVKAVIRESPTELESIYLEGA